MTPLSLFDYELFVNGHKISQLCVYAGNDIIFKEMGDAIIIQLGFAIKDKIVTRRSKDFSKNEHFVFNEKVNNRKCFSLYLNAALLDGFVLRDIICENEREIVRYKGFVCLHPINAEEKYIRSRVADSSELTPYGNILEKINKIRKTTLSGGKDSKWTAEEIVKNSIMMEMIIELFNQVEKNKTMKIGKISENPTVQSAYENLRLAIKLAGEL